MDTPSLDRDFLRYREHGDSEALARVFDGLAPKLLLVAQHLTRNGASAEDLVQSTFLEALRSARDYDGRRPLLAWMSGILAHRALDERRRARVRAAQPVGTDLAAGEDPLDASAERETIERVSTAIDALEPPYRDVLVLRVVHGLSPTEIAHALGRAPGTVRMQLARARERLRERLPRELLLPALFLRDDGAGLATVRHEVLRAARPLVVGTIGSSGLAVKGLAAAALILTLGGWIWWQARDSTIGRGPEPVLASSPVPESEPTDPQATLVSVSTPAATQREPVARLLEPPERSTGTEDESIRVVGLVTTLDGTPLADAALHVLTFESGGVGPVCARSGSDGRFTLDAPLGALVVARKPGHQPSGGRSGKATVRAAAGGTAMLVLRMGADGLHLQGEVRDARGPVAGACVAVCVDEDAREQREGMPVARERQERPLDRDALVLVTDEEGRFASDEVPAGEAVLLARAPGSAGIGWSTVDVRAGERAEVELLLGPGASVSGRVQTTLAPESLRIVSEWKGERELGSLDDDNWGPLFAHRAVACASDGRYRLEGLFPGEHELSVFAGRQRLARGRVEVAAGGHATLDFELAASFATSVRVLGPEDEPLDGWGFVWSRGETFDSSRAREIGLPSALDHDGRAAITSIESGEHVFGLHAPDRGAATGFAPFPRVVWRVVHPTAGEILLRASAAELAGARVQGTWLDERGLPLAQAELRLVARDYDSGLAGSTDEAGRFAFAGLPAGEFALDASNRSQPRTMLAEFTLATGEERELGTLQLAPAAHLVLEVVGSDGSPVEAGGVAIDAEGKITSLEAEGSTGRLVCRPLATTEVLVRIMAPGYPVHVERLELAPGIAVPRRIELRPGVPVDLRIHLAPPVPDCAMVKGGGRVHLTLRTPEGMPAFERRFDGPLQPGRQLHLTVELAPGRYLGTLEDHTCDNAPRPMPTVPLEFEVRSDGALPVEVVFP